jgi:hypothetical protein
MIRQEKVAEAALRGTNILVVDLMGACKEFHLAFNILFSQYGAV